MADVAVRFTVQNAEAVRQALAALGKDGAAALKQLEAGTAAPNRGLNAVSTLVDAAKGRMMGLATSIGPAGQAMVQLGPAGMAAAAAIGLVGAAFSAANEHAQRVGEWARKVREAAETAGMTTDQFQALTRASSQAGLSFEQSAEFVTKMTTAVEQLRHGTGPLFDALARIDAALVREVAGASSTAEAFDALARAYQRLTDAGQRNALLTAIGGRGSTALGRVLSQWGGSAEEIDRARQANRLASEEQLRAQDEMWRNLVKTREEADKIWGRLLAPSATSALQLVADLWLSIARAAERIRAADSGETGSRVGDGGNLALGPQGTRRPTGLPSAADMLGGTIARDPWAANMTVTPTNWAVELSLMRQWTAIAGDALTLAEQRVLRETELAAAVQAAGTSEQSRAQASAAAARAMASFNAAQAATIASTRQRLGVVTEEQVITARLADLQQMRARGFITTDAEMAAAERLMRREVRETMEALQVRQSLTPGLTRLAIDAANLTKTLDEGLTGALRGATGSMLDMLKGTKSLGEGFTELATRILDAVTQALILKSIVGPLSNGISSGINSMFADPWAANVTPSAMGNVFAGGRLTPFRMGGVVHRPSIFAMANGGVGIMSENEPEAVMPLRRMGSGRLGVEAAGGGGVNVTFVVENHTSSRVTQREESDGRGGRKITAVIEEMVAGALARPGSRASGALFAGQGMTRL